MEQTLDPETIALLERVLIEVEEPLPFGARSPKVTVRLASGILAADGERGPVRLRFAALLEIDRRIHGQTKLLVYLAFDESPGLGACPDPSVVDANMGLHVDETDNSLIGNRHLHGGHRYEMVSVPRHVHELVHVDPKKFRAAARHSRHVRLLRIALPIGVALVLGWLAFKPFRIPGSLHVIPGSVAISGTRITMGSPRYDGFTNDGHHYEVAARTASQDITKPDVVDLHDIWAKAQLQDNATIEMTAANGVYDSKRDRLTLNDQILLSTSTGYSGRLRDAVVEIKNGNVLSENPVELTFLNGTLSANRFEIENHGDVIRFGGGVEMNLTNFEGR